MPITLAIRGTLSEKTGWSAAGGGNTACPVRLPKNPALHRCPSLLPSDSGLDHRCADERPYFEIWITSQLSRLCELASGYYPPPCSISGKPVSKQTGQKWRRYAVFLPAFLLISKRCGTNKTHEASIHNLALDRICSLVTTQTRDSKNAAVHTTE